MKLFRTRLWRGLLIGALTMPLLQTSCIDVAQRSVINSFFQRRHATA